MIRESDKMRFERVCRDVLLADRTREGIGTLNEKKLHTMLKCFVCDDMACHEIKVFSQLPEEQDGEGKSPRREKSYVADVLQDYDIFEIQTGPLYPLKSKLKFYLEQTDYNITVIHPLAAKKWVNYMDPEDGTITRRAVSPKKERPRDMLPALYPLIDLLGNRRLRFRALMVEAEEFKLKSGSRGRRSKKYERIPTALLDIVDFNVPADYLEYVPEGLPELFTAAEFGKAAGYRGIDVYSALKVLVKMGLIRQDGTRGRAATYRII